MSKQDVSLVLESSIGDKADLIRSCQLLGVFAKGQRVIAFHHPARDRVCIRTTSNSGIRTYILRRVPDGTRELHRHVFTGDPVYPKWAIWHHQHVPTEYPQTNSNGYQFPEE